MRIAQIPAPFSLKSSSRVRYVTSRELDVETLSLSLSRVGYVIVRSRVLSFRRYRRYHRYRRFACRVDFARGSKTGSEVALDRSRDAIAIVVAIV